MHTYEATIAYNEPRTAVVTVEAPNTMSLIEAEDLVMEEFEEQYPEALDAEVLGEVKELN